MPATTESLIRKTPGVMGGEACIRRTRIAVWNLVAMKRLGFSDEHILYQDFPGQLTQEDLDAAWAYYQAHPEEIEDVIRRNDEA